MELRKVEISLKTATRWYSGQDAELKELALQTYPELKKELPKSWEELKKIQGWIIDEDDSEIEKTLFVSAYVDNQNIFKTENQAKSALAMAKLSQLMAVYNDGWAADYNNEDQEKYVIVKFRNKIQVNKGGLYKEFLTFKSEKLAYEFLKNFRKEIETYFNF